MVKHKYVRVVETHRDRDGKTRQHSVTQRTHRAAVVLSALGITDPIRPLRPTMVVGATPRAWPECIDRKNRPCREAWRAYHLSLEKSFGSGVE
jgi:hypothetical protein